MTNVWTQAVAFTRLVKLEHTIFALPFALSSLLLATPLGQWPPFDTTLWVILAFIGGRTYAMGLNRLIDADIDAKNPRTASREIPSGQVSRPIAWLWTLSALGVMILTVLPLPLLCLQLLPLAIGILTLYSFTKRFTSLCHLVLGLALGSSAIGGWLALTGHWDGGLPVLFGVVVLSWVAGFDIIYATQDVDFDQAEGLWSIPAQLGISKALVISRLLHLLTILSLVGFGVWFSYVKGSVGWGYWVATLLTAVMLCYEQRLVNASDLSKVDAAFFTVNGFVSISFFGCLLLNRLFG